MTSQIMKSVPERVGILEQGVNTLAESLKEWQKENRVARENLASEIKALRVEIGARAIPTDWRAVGGTIVMTVTLMSAFIAGANFWFAAKSSPTEQTVTRLEQQARDQNPAVLRYRVDEIERLLRRDNKY